MLIVRRHTPGPWVAVTDEFGCKQITAHQVEVASTPGLSNEEEDLANAHLIAASPDLFEALEALLFQRDRPHGFPDNPWYEEEFGQARTALAKARGEPS